MAFSGKAVLARFVVPQRLSPEAAARALERWMGGNQPSRWLASGAVLEPPKLEWLPVWYARGRAGADGDKARWTTVEQRAHETLVPEVRRRPLPAAGLRRLDEQDVARDLPQPTLAFEQFRATRLKDLQLAEQALVHAPYYRYVYRYRGRRYSAAVDAATGEVRPGRFPKRMRWPFVMLSLAALSVFATADIWFVAAWYWDLDRPAIIPGVYPFAWGGGLVLALLLAALL